MSTTLKGVARDEDLVQAGAERGDLRLAGLTEEGARRRLSASSVMSERLEAISTCKGVACLARRFRRWLRTLGATLRSPKPNRPEEHSLLAPDGERNEEPARIAC